MTLTDFPNLEQGTDEWFAARRGIVTASTVGRLISSTPPVGTDVACPECDTDINQPCISRTKTRAPLKTLHGPRVALAKAMLRSTLEAATGDDAKGLTAQLVAERITGHVEPTWASDAMLQGHVDEVLARDVYSEHFAPVTTTGFMVEDKWGFRIGYSPDGLVGDDGLIEVKSRRQKKQLQTILADEVPAENMAQLQCGLLVSGREWIDYLSYCGGMPMYRKRVFPDQRWFDAIVAAVAAFEDNAKGMTGDYSDVIARLRLPMTERSSDLGDILTERAA